MTMGWHLEFLVLASYIATRDVSWNMIETGLPSGISDEWEDEIPVWKVINNYRRKVWHEE